MGFKMKGWSGFQKKEPESPIKFDFKALYEEFAGLVNGTHSSGMVTIFDGVTSTGITGITAVHQVTKVSSD